MQVGQELPHGRPPVVQPEQPGVTAPLVHARWFVNLDRWRLESHLAAADEFLAAPSVENICPFIQRQRQPIAAEFQRRATTTCSCSAASGNTQSSDQPAVAPRSNSSAHRRPVSRCWSINCSLRTLLGEHQVVKQGRPEHELRKEPGVV